MKLHIAIDTAREQTITRGVRHFIACDGRGTFRVYDDEAIDGQQAPVCASFTPAPSGGVFKIIDDAPFFRAD